MGFGARERVVGAGVVDDDDAIGPPGLTLQRFQALAEQIRAVPIDDDDGDSHVVSAFGRSWRTGSICAIARGRGRASTAIV